MRCLLVLVLGPLLTPASSPVPVADLRTIDRSIKNEPKYATAPRYALVVLGPDAERRIWVRRFRQEEARSTLS
jgi:hypothetical protein